jgi:hypothetical protein
MLFKSHSCLDRFFYKVLAIIDFQSFRLDVNKKNVGRKNVSEPKHLCYLLVCRWFSIQLKIGYCDRKEKNSS